MLPTRSTRFLAVCVLACTASSSAFAQSAAHLQVDEAATRLTFPADHFQLALAVKNGDPPVSAQVSAELIDAEDTVRSRASATCQLTAGANLCQLEMPSATPSSQRPGTGDNALPLFRIRYSVSIPGTPTLTGILPLASIAPDLFELHFAAPRDIHPGGAYTFRLRALHPLTHQPRPNLPLESTVTATYDAPDRSYVPFAHQSIVTDAEGFATITFTAPKDSDLEEVELQVQGTLANLHPAAEARLSIPENLRFDLTTDKPLYQPGQSVHTRLLLLDRNGHANPGKNLRVDISDPDSTLVYRAEAVTSTFGIATIDWPVPARIRLGEYTLKATIPTDPGSNRTNTQTAQATLRLSRYDLPTFVVQPVPDRPFYLPGSNATVDVRANYLFGKPVLHGHVRVVREDDRTWNFADQRYDTKEGKSVSGELDAEGLFRAQIPLADDLKPYLDRDPSNEFEDLHLAAYVTDTSTGRTEERRFDLRIANQALHILVTSGPQTKGVAQLYYVAATTAAGIPAPCDLAVTLLPYEKPKDTLARRRSKAVPLLHLTTDAHGLARLTLPTYEALLKQVPGGAPSDASTPGIYDGPTIYIAAHDNRGDSGAITQDLTAPTETYQITTQNTLYHPGDPLEIAIDSAEPSSPLTVQIIRRTLHGDLTLASREVSLINGHADLTIPTDERFTGFVFVQAIALSTKPIVFVDSGPYQSSQDPQIALASRAVLFPRDNSLHIGIRMSAETYAPGAQATAALSVQGPQDPDGEDTAPAPSALGIVAVDQAVEERNRTDNDFGGSNAEPFFFSWRSDFEGFDSVGGFTLESLEQSLDRLGPAKPFPAGAQLAAELLLASRTLEFGAASSAAPENLVGVFGAVLDSQLKPARDFLTEYLKTHTEAPTTKPELAALLAPGGIHLTELCDPWGTPYSVVPIPDNSGSLSLTLRSNGPDKLPGTADDFPIPLTQWRWFQGRNLQLKHALDSYHQRTGHFIRNLADLRNEMRQEGIDLDGWRNPWGQPFRYRFSIEQTRFSLQAASPGDPNSEPGYLRHGGNYFAGSASIDYTVDFQKRISQALSLYSVSHPYPAGITQLEAALRASGIHLDRLTDPWHHSLYVTFRSRQFFTDRRQTEIHATPGGESQPRTTITPVTAISDAIDFHSLGQDGKRNTGDDFIYATFSRVRTLQSAQESTAKRPPLQPVNPNESGNIAGTVLDVTGAVIPGAVITATDEKTAMEYEGKSDEEGNYLLGPLPAGVYRVRFAARGFMDMVYEQIQLVPLNTVILDAKLSVGTETETVEVSASAMSLQTSSAQVVDQAQISTLLPLPPPPPPIAGRNFTALASLGLGVSSAQPTPRLRNYFPETLIWRPEIITAPDGTATLQFPVADNITTWQLSAAASTLAGNTGAGKTQFRTFQPFFAAFDPPSILTAGDTIALPITLRNYLDHLVTVRASLTPAPWFRLDGPATATTPVPAQDAASPIFRFTALTPVTDAAQEFTAQPDGPGDRGDRITRPVTVHPDGLESAATASAILAPGENTLTLTLPPDTLPASADTTLKLYPNLAAHLRDALLSMMNLPGGCAEQLISIAWPNLLLQRYAASLPKPDDKLQQLTRRNLQEAYESLLANQLPSGGFAYWPKDANADLALTAYAVQFLTQARAFIAIDDAVLTRAVTYLARQQQPASAPQPGLWIRVDRAGKAHPEDTHASIMLTASIAAMISSAAASAPGAEPLLKNALPALQPFIQEFDEPYALAGYALAAIALKDSPRAEPALQRLRTLAHTENGGAYWALETNTPFFGWGRAGRVEATAQVLRALLAAGAGPQDDLIARGLLYLDHEQDRHTLWYSTQATARVLDVMAAIALQSPAPPAGSDPGSLTVQVEGQSLITIPLPPATQDAGPIFVPLTPALTPGTHPIKLKLPASAQSATAQLVSNFYRPWPTAAPSSSTANNEQLRMTVAYSATNPEPAKPVEVTAHLERIGFEGYGMMIAEIGLPPGADVDRATLESAVSASDYQLNHYEVLPDKVLIYLWPNAGGLTLHFLFTLRYSIDAQTAPSSLYDYYNPDARLDLSPTRISTK